MDLRAAPVDFTTTPWNDASPVTPRHAVQTQWNGAAVRKMCKDTGRRLYIISADDTYKGRPLNLQEKYTLASHLGKKKNGKKQHGVARTCTQPDSCTKCHAEVDWWCCREGSPMGE
ncbi:hypothetical protein B0H14DRAFT_2557417 [Mycena olivaceomarginata]|nr:hypothetical protein B0H14DRAFT_2557417 [Mycena olivaceomarginata]